MTTSIPTPLVPPVIPGTGNNIIINPLQRGNAVLDCIRNVGKEFGDIVADYQVGRTTGVLFLSLKYHRIHPEYIHLRIEKLGYSYTLRVLLILCDITEHRDAIRELTKACIVHKITILVAFSFEEAGHYLSTFKQFEHKPPDMIKERVDKDYNAMLRTVLTSVSKVNKTDVETLRTSFGSFANIGKATSDQLQNLPGFGQVKVKNIKNMFEKPIRNNAIRTQPPVLPQITMSQDLRPTMIGVVSQDKELSSVRPIRKSSPLWDIELDDGYNPLSKPPPESFESIELDLN